MLNTLKIEDVPISGTLSTARIWKCCGLQWEMILTPVWVGSFANFTCPKCGSNIEPPEVPLDKPDFAF